MKDWSEKSENDHENFDFDFEFFCLAIQRILINYIVNVEYIDVVYFFINYSSTLLYCLLPLTLSICSKERKT